MVPIIGSTLLSTDLRCDLCNGELVREYIAVKDKWHTIYVYKCTFCGAEYDFKVHACTPLNCPKHLWVFSHREFFDNPFSHSIEMVFVCDRCGQERREYQDTYKAGISGRVEIDDPRVSPSIVMNKSWAKHFVDREEFKEFYKNVTDKPQANIIV